MTNEEFFEKVKGKKIRYSNWPGQEYFIPIKLVLDKWGDWTIVNEVGEGYLIRKQFERDKFNGKWEFYEEPKQEMTLDKQKYGIKVAAKMHGVIE